MGTYTEINCAFELIKETPQDVIAILTHMLDRRNHRPTPMPTHPLFETESWDMLLTSSSYYFAATEAQSAVWLDEIDGQHRVAIRSNLKNYDDEIEEFIDWITPYIDALPGDFLGYSRYENTEVPTLIYHPRIFFTPEVPQKVLAPHLEDGWD
jgi:hypothetical protein